MAGTATATATATATRRGILRLLAGAVLAVLAAAAAPLFPAGQLADLHEASFADAVREDAGSLVLVEFYAVSLTAGVNAKASKAPTLTMARVMSSPLFCLCFPMGSHGVRTAKGLAPFWISQRET